MFRARCLSIVTLLMLLGSLVAFCFFTSVYAEIPPDVLAWQHEAQQHVASRDYLAAIESNRLIALAYPDTPYCIEAQARIASAYLEMGMVTQADAVIDNMVEVNSGQTNLALNLNNMADRYYKKNEYAKANDLYRIALSKGFNDSDLLCSSAGIAKTIVWLGCDIEDPNIVSGEFISSLVGTSSDPNEMVDSIISGMISGHAANKSLGCYLFGIGEAYYLKGENLLKSHHRKDGWWALEKALQIWKTVRNETSDPTYQAPAAYYMAVTNGYLQNDADALLYYQDVLYNFPDFKKAWHAQHMIARYAEALNSHGKMTMQEAIRVYQAAYSITLPADPNDFVHESLIEAL